MNIIGKEFGGENKARAKATGFHLEDKAIP